MNEHRVMGVLERIGRRIMTTIGQGRKTTGDDSGNVQLLQVKLGQNELRDNTPRLAEFGFTSMPPDGADLVVLFVGGDRSNGVIIASGDISTRLKNLKPGESALYDSIGKHIHLKADQIEVDAKSQPVNIVNATTVTINASGDVALNCGGNLTATVTGGVTVNGANIKLKGGGGADRGIVQGNCVCAFTGAPHPQISATVTGTA